MKKCIAIILIIISVLCFTACGNPNTEPTETTKETPKHQEIVTEATAQLKKYWKQAYDEYDIETDGYFEIKNTRVITIKENEIERFKDVAYIIEYELYTDYMGSAPYYENCDVNNNVVVYQNGTMDIVSNLIRIYKNETYQTDYSDFIEAIDDYHDQYNCAEILKSSQQPSLPDEQNQ